MQYLSLAALQLALTDLFTNRYDALVASATGKTYEPMLRKRKETIDALPEAVISGKPLVEALTYADDRHDSFGSAIWHLTEAYMLWPDVPADVRHAASRIRAAFVPRLGVLRAAYVNEAHASINNKKDLATLEADLKMIPVAGGLSLYDWCAGFVAAGESIGTLLEERADVNTNARSEASRLRASTVGLLNRFRTALADEIDHNPDFSPELDAKVFGYFDELGRMRADAVAKKKAPGTNEAEA